MIDKEAIQYVISKVNDADEKGVELTEFDINKVETLISIINRQQAEIEGLNHSIDTLGRVKEQLKENLSETEAKYQKEITRLDALLVCKNKVIRGLEKSFENAYDGAIKEFAARLQEKADDIGIDEDGFLFTISAEWKTWFSVGDWCEEIIDNLVKEMVGEDK